MSTLSPILILTAISLLTPPAHAQTITASLEGIVTDPTNAVIVGAKVRVVSAATNAVIALETDSNGRFLAPSLPPGAYQLIVEASGFKKAERTGIALQVNQAARLELQLELGAATETVSVNATAPLLEANSAALGQVVSNQSIVNLPLNQRNPFALVFLVPGVVGSVGFNFNNANISINGGRPGSNEILADGIPSAPPLVNPIQGYSVFPSVDAVQEFKVQTNSYSAEFGRSGGGVINLVFKSGTNQLHGSVFEFLRNSKLDANDFFANSRGVPLPSFKRNQFGASAGGPVYLGKLYDGRNRTFFHFTYEGLRQGQLQNQVTTVPTALQRAGNFSQTLNAAGQQVIIFDPTTTTPSGTGFVRQPFAGNIIPTARLDPVGAAAARFYPQPNGPGNANSGTNNFAASGKSVVNINQFDVKGDEILNDYHRLFFRYSRRRLSPAPPDYFPADVLVAQGGSFQPQHYNNAAFDYTWSAAPTTLLNFRYGLGRTAFFYRPRSDGFNPSQLGFPNYIAANSDRIMFPGFASQGYVNLGNGGAGDFSNAAFETHIAGASATKVLTSHTLKMGYEARMLRVNTLQAGASTGNHSFTRAFTQGPNPNQATAIAGDGVASLLVGLGSGTFTQKFKDVATTSTYHAIYFADDYKVTRRLTLNLGMRYELQVPRTERYNRLNVFNPLVRSPLAGPSGLAGLTGGLEFVGLDGRGRRQYETQRTNLAPRFGFAYELNRATVIRGGYGIFFAPSMRSAAGTVSNTGYRSDSSY
ncbi:MAG: TonB-dependent receptor, partial [Bryobacterales bacterium]|nr:TonB-dependent receptor [Bryobacterales bacterium]